MYQERRSHSGGSNFNALGFAYEQQEHSEEISQRTRRGNRLSESWNDKESSHTLRKLGTISQKKETQLRNSLFYAICEGVQRINDSKQEREVLQTLRGCTKTKNGGTTRCSVFKMRFICARRKRRNSSSVEVPSPSTVSFTHGGPTFGTIRGDQKQQLEQKVSRKGNLMNWNPCIPCPRIVL